MKLNHLTLRLVLISGIVIIFQSCSTPVIHEGIVTYNKNLQGDQGAKDFLKEISTSLDSKQTYHYKGLRSYKPMVFFNSSEDSKVLLSMQFENFIQEVSSVENDYSYMLRDGSILNVIWSYSSEYDAPSNTKKYLVEVKARHSTKSGTLFSKARTQGLNSKNKGYWADTVKQVDWNNKQRVLRQEQIRVRKEAKERRMQEIEEKRRQEKLRTDQMMHDGIMDAIRSI